MKHHWHRCPTGIVAVVLLLGLTGCSTYNGQARFFPEFQPHNSYQAHNYRFPNTREATGHKVFIFDPKHTTYGLYNEHGFLIRQGRASGGKGYCPDINRSCLTPSGKYQIYRKEGSDCKSSKYPVGEGGAPMPHCMFFNGGYAIHGSPYVPDYNASHGCIRVPPGDAAWLSN